MTKILLSCDDYVYKHNDCYYAANQEKYDFYQRYLRIFERLKLVTRCISEEYLNDKRVKLDDERIEYVPLPIFHGPKQYIKVYFSIGRIIKDIIGDCNVAILRIPSTVAIRIGKIVKRKHIPYGVELVSDAYDGAKYSTSFISKILWKKIDRDTRLLSYQADGVSCVTQFYMQQHYYSKKYKAFHTYYSSLALDASFYSSERQYPNKDMFTLVHVASQVQFNGNKGQREVIDVIRKINSRGFNVKVKFIGGDYNNGILLLQKYAEQINIDDKIEFLGVLNKAEIGNILQNSDIFILPTLYEGLPRVVIEAMAKGLPCVSTNVSGIPELIQKDFLVDNYRNVDEMVACVLKLITNPQLYENASRYNYQHSLDYEASVLQHRRDEFYSKLKKISK